MATQLEVSRLLGVSDRWIQKLAEQGVISRRARGEWDAIEAGKELLAYSKKENERLKAEVASLKAQRAAAESISGSKADEDLRLAKAKADKAEMETAQMRGDLVTVQEVIEPFQNAVLIMKTLMLAIPAKAAPQVGAKNPARAEEVIREHVTEALEELSKVRVVRSGVA